MITDQAIIFILSMAGFAVSFYIYYNKSNNKHIMCPIGEKDSCNNVLNSKYNSILGVDNAVMGVFYFGFIALFYLASIFGLVPPVEYVAKTMLFVTGGSAAFSVYLTFVQAFIIKEYCQWCLVSATFSVLIFAVLFV